MTKTTETTTTQSGNPARGASRKGLPMASKLSSSTSRCEPLIFDVVPEDGPNFIFGTFLPDDRHHRLDTLSQLGGQLQRDALRFADEATMYAEECQRSHYCRARAKFLFEMFVAVRERWHETLHA
jgi:hypothetical protein